MATAHDFLVRRPHLTPAAIAAVMLLAAVFVAYKGWTFKLAWAV